MARVIYRYTLSHSDRFPGLEREMHCLLLASGRSFLTSRRGILSDRFIFVHEHDVHDDVD